ncbi:hypothetical protein JCM10212_000920, partial [Sporobolomyces blumeae]
MHAPTRLSTLLPPYFPHDDLSRVLARLASLDILSDVDLLWSPNLDPPPVDLDPRIVSRIQDIARSNLAAPSTSGLQLISASSSSPRPRPPRISTTLAPLDSILFGTGAASSSSSSISSSPDPDPPPRVIELVGPPSSGRTLLALHIALSHLARRRRARLAFVDSTRSFDPFRCLEVLIRWIIPTLRRQGDLDPEFGPETEFDSSKGGRGGGGGDGGREDETDRSIAMDVLDRVSVSSVSPGASGQVLDKIVEELEPNRTTTTHGALEIVIVDQVDDVLLPREAPADTRSQANLVAFMRRLASLARAPSRQPLTILLINTLVPSHVPPPPPPQPRPPPPPQPSSSTSVGSNRPPEATRTPHLQPPPITSVPILSSVVVGSSTPFSFVNHNNHTTTTTTTTTTKTTGEARTGAGRGHGQVGYINVLNQHYVSMMAGGGGGGGGGGGVTTKRAGQGPGHRGTGSTTTKPTTTTTVTVVESWSNLVETSIVLIPDSSIFTLRRPTGGTGGGGGSERRQEMIVVLEVGKNDRGVGGRGEGCTIRIS